MRAEVCVQNGWGGGAALPSHMYEWTRLSRTAWLVHSLHFCPFVLKKEKTEAEPSQGPPICFHEWPLQGETVPHCQVIWQKSFLRHLMLNSSTLLHIFFFFGLPLRICLQIRFSCQAGSCWGLNDHSRCMVRQKEQNLSWRWRQKREG